MPSPPDHRLILFLGADWWGSDSRALAMAFRKLGHAVVEVNSENFYPIHWSSTPLRILRRACEGLFARDFNRASQRHLANRAIDFMLVFKGRHVHPRTLRDARAYGLPAYCFYPDVSFLDHGPSIWACLPHYDCVFTTKSFHLDDAKLKARVRDLRLVSHGFDPDVHRPLRLSRRGQAAYTCDVSFVGCWSPKKEQILNGLLDQCPGIDLRVWGPGWTRATGAVHDRWRGRGAYGDELSAIYCSSRINLALLSESGGGTRVGDQVTARTWQIPASGSFMLHEETAELERYFTPGTETGTFRSPEELAARVRGFLDNEAARNQIALAGYRRCVEQGYTYLPAAEAILAYHRDHLPSPLSAAPSLAPSEGERVPARAGEGLSPSPPLPSPLSPSSPAASRVLFVGPLVKGSTTLQRLETFRGLGYAVQTVSTRKDTSFVEPTLLQRVEHKLLGPVDRADANRGVVSAVQRGRFDLVWIEKGLTIHPATLRQIRAAQPACRIIGFSLDDMMNPANQSGRFLRSLPLYDWYITNKSYNVAELKALGCSRVVFMDNGFDPATHRPVPVTADERKRLGGPVGFVGQWEPDRARSLRALARAGMPVRVWGYTWQRMRTVPPSLVLENQPVWGDDYAKAICAFDINLCFLRKVNRDRQTTRSLEIPACGAFMLAERTDEHLRLFEEGKEAEFFSDDRELIQKARYFLEHPQERLKIAQGGYERCLRSGYSYPERLRQVLATLKS
jgi:spore maturation protein CgeB